MLWWMHSVSTGGWQAVLGAQTDGQQGRSGERRTKRRSRIKEGALLSAHACTAFLGRITSMPIMKGRSTSGTTTLPSG
jgi:thiamine phosphate synthase YjbQ (UPF0047 family)